MLLSRPLVLALPVLVAGCALLPPAPKYDVRRGLTIVGNGAGACGYEADAARAYRAGSTAAILVALGDWCEEFASLKREVEQSSEEIPIDLYDPENPPDDIRNLEPYQPTFVDLAARLSFEQQLWADEGTEDRARGYRLRCSLRPGVDFTYEAEWDEFGIQTRDLSTLVIGARSGYHQEAQLRVEAGELGDPGLEVVPLEYIQRLIEGHGIEVAIRSLPDAKAEATLTKRLAPQ